MSIWKTPLTPAIANERCRQTFSDFLQIVYTEVGDDYLLARMPVNARVLQPAGIMHGGASCVLAESIGSVAANFCVDAKQFYCVGLDINTNHIRSIREGFVLATAKPFHLGKTTQVWHIEIHDEAKRLISINRLTMAVLKRAEEKV